MHSLISKADLLSNNKFDKDYVFNKEEVEILKSKLNKDIRDLQGERYYSDPPIHGQKIALVSFIPSKGATPDNNGWYGCCKVRYVTDTPEDASRKAEELIKSTDSLHRIYHVNVGKTFPICDTDKYAADKIEVDVKRQSTKIISEDIMKKKEDAKKEMEEQQEKEKLLLEKSKEAEDGKTLAEIDPYEVYINQNVKRSQLLWTYAEAKKKIVKMKESYLDAVKIIKEYDEKYPTFKDNYKEKYFQARKDAGLSDESNTEKSFLEYLSLDLDVDWESI